MTTIDETIDCQKEMAVKSGELQIHHLKATLFTNQHFSIPQQIRA